MKLILGGYHEAYIRLLDLDSMVINKVSSYANTSYMFIDNEFIYSIVRINELAGLVKLDKNNMNVACINVHESIPSCYVFKHNNYIFTCNYHLGTLNIYTEQLSIVKILIFKDNSKIHCITFNNNHYYVCDLSNDCIYKFDHNFNLLDTITLVNRCGPRHIIFDNDVMYVACELSNELIVLDNDIIIRRIKLSDDINASVAAIKQDELNIYISVRGTNKIYIISKKDLEIVNCLDTLGRDPRDFLVHNNYIIIVHQNSDDITIYKEYELFTTIKAGKYIYIDKL